MTHYRWVICGLLFLATTINYVDRSVFSLLGPGLQKDYGWTDSQFSLVVNAFTLAYAISYSLAGRMMDRIGERRGFALAVGLWSLAAMAHGLINPLVDSGLPWLNAAFAGTILGGLTPTVLSIIGFCCVRFALGLAEGGNFPGAIKTVGMWHPVSERALSTGLFNAGSNMGIITAAFAVPFVVKKMEWGWPAAFYLAGLLGLVWVVFWLLMYDRPERHPRVSPAELDHIRRDPPDPPVHIPWVSLLKYRQTWACAWGNFMICPAWWFYLYWTPKFLKNNFGLDLAGVCLPMLIVYLMADLGSVSGGGLSSWLIRRGKTVNAARKTAFLCCALCAIPMMFIARVDNAWVAVVFLGLAAAADTGFSANLFTIVSDTVPRKAISSVVGIGGTAGCIGSMMFTWLIGCILDWSRKPNGDTDYLIPFLIAGSAYFAATAGIHLLLPRLEPMKFDEKDTAVADTRMSQ